MKRPLQVYLRSLLLSGLFLLMGTSSYANHISALDLAYTYVSSTGSGATMSSTYLVTVTIYGNCSDQTGSFATLATTTAPQVCVYNGTTAVTTLTLTLQGPGENVTNVCTADTGLTTCTVPTSTIAGNEKYVYSATVTLTGTSALWRFVYQGYNGAGAEAGRSSQITTLGTGSTNSIVYMVDTLNNTAAIPYNTSTTLPVIPTPYYCQNEPDNYNPGATNSLGDSLVFQLVQPRIGTGATACASASAGNVTYTGTGITATTPISGASPFSFSSTNGQLSFTPATLATSVLDYNVREFRNGVFVGNTMREMNIIVATCTAPAPTAAIRTPTNGAVTSDSTTFETCINSGVFSFTIAGIESDTTVDITMTASNLPTGSTYSVANNGTKHPVATFTWTSTGVTAGTYPFDILFSGNTCPVTSSASLAFNVIVEPTPSAFTGTTTICSGSSQTLADALTGGTWSSSNTAVATAGSSSGTIYGVTGGTSTITYSYSAAACSVNAPVTVNGPAAITGTLTVCPTLTTQLADVTTGGTWSSSSTAIATVGSTGIVTGVAGGTANITYTQVSTGCYVVAPVTVTALAAITPATSTVCIGNTITLADATTGGVWSSSAIATATVSTAGVVGGVAAGTVSIFYTVGTCYATATVSVSATGPAAITPATATTCIGGTVTLADASTGGTWSSSSTGIATVNSTTGVVTGAAAGVATISYFLGGCHVIRQVTVISAVGAVTPATSTICIANTETLAEASTGGTWSSSLTTVATVGSTGIVTGVTAGTTLISYTIGSCAATATVTVSAGPAALSPAAPVICRGSTITLTDATTGGTWASNNTTVASVVGGVVTGSTLGTAIISYTAIGCAATVVTTVVAAPAAILPATALICTGNTTTLTESVTGGVWASSNTAVATVVNGVVTGGATVGTATISYSSGTCIVTAIVTVNLAPDPGIITGASIVCVGGTTPLADVATGGTWTSSATAVATVTAAGVVSGVTSGTTTISYSKTASCGTVSTTHVVSVNPAPSAGAITGATSICSGTTSLLADLTTGGTWSSSNTHATINSTSGLLTAVSPGLDTITYTITSSCGSVTATLGVTIGAFLSAGTITGSATSICGGATLALTDATTGGTWSATNTSASVNTAGLVTGSAAGGIDTINYTVTSTCGSAVATYVLTVNGTASASPIVGSSVICLGSSAAFTDATTGGTWSASNTNVTVSTAGLVTGAALGTATVSYTVSNSCGTSTVTLPVTVSASVTAGTISGASTLCIGSSATLTDAAPGGVWSSSNTTASVTSGGVITGLATGTDTISYTVTTGCGTAVATHIITISSTVVTAGTIAGPSAVCVGSLISLTDAAGGGAWSSSNANATITTGGLVTGITPGTDTISYTITSSCGIAATTKIITVSAVAGAGTISGPTVVCTGATITLTDPTTGGVWTSLNSNATVAASNGVVTGVASGADIITYTVTTGCGTIGTTYGITISASATAGTISGPDSVCNGSTIALVDFTGGGTWSAGNTNATITGGGVVTGVTVGTTPITYSVTNSCGTANAIKIISIVPAPVSGVISGLSAVCVGSGITLVDAAPGGSWIASNGNATVVGPGIIDGVTVGVDTIFYVVSNSCGTSSASRILNVNPTPVVPSLSGPTHQCTGTLILLLDGTGGGVFSSNDTLIADINPTTGVITGMGVGVTTLSYTVTNIYGCPATVTSIDTVTASPGLSAITGSTTACIGATVTLSDATSGGVWTSADASIATINPASGVLTGVSTGTVIVSYTVVNSCGTSFVVRAETINPLPTVSPIAGAAGTCIGSSIILTDATAGGTWSSDNTSIATVDATTGTVTGIAAGTVNINYNYVGTSCPITVSTPITITSGPTVAAITGTTSECIGTTARLFDGTPGGVWSSSNTLVAAVTGGVVTGNTSGTAIISYTVTDGTGCGTSAVVIDTVLAIPVEAPITGVTALCAGGTITLSNAIRFGSWSTANAAIAQVNPLTGVVTGISGGTTEIYYTVANICGFALDSVAVTVAPAPAVSAIVAAYTSLCAGTNVLLADATTGGVWTSTDPAIATVNAATGLVTGVSAGTDTVLYTLSITGGCSASAAITITIGGSIGAGSVAPSGPQTLCHGATILMHVVGASSTGTTYQWLLNGGAISGATNSSYTATSIGIYAAAINNGICSGVLTGPTVVSPPNPVIALTAPNILYTGSFPSYQWYLNGSPITGANGSSVVATGAGTYKVVVTDYNGCSDTSGGYIVTAPTASGVNGVTSNDAVRIYPNPATSMIHIDAAVSVNVSVVGIDGKVLISKKGVTGVDVSSLADGLYMIMVYDEAGQLLKVAKFAKEQ